MEKEKTKTILEDTLQPLTTVAHTTPEEPGLSTDHKKKVQDKEENIFQEIASETKQKSEKREKVSWKARALYLENKIKEKEEKENQQKENSESLKALSVQLVVMADKIIGLSCDKFIGKDIPKTTPQEIKSLAEATNNYLNSLNIEELKPGELLLCTVAMVYIPKILISFSQ